MRFIKRIITTISSILGASMGIILMGLFNWSLHLGLSVGNVFLYGLIGGIISGIMAGYLLTYYIIRRTRRFIFNKFAGQLTKFSFLRRL